MHSQYVMSVDDGHADQAVALVASVPLSNEAWVPLVEGEVLALVGGRVAEETI